MLQRPLDGDLTEIITAWCKRVEFPILVSDGGTTTQVQGENPADFEYEEPSALDGQEVMGVRSYPFSSSGAEGEIYVFYRRTERGEVWTDYGWAAHTYPNRHPDARPPRLPDELICFHGIALRHGGRLHSLIGVTARLDYRKHLSTLSLDRHSTWESRERLGLADPEVNRFLVSLVREHVKSTGYADGPSAWRYKQRLIETTGLVDYWLDDPATVRMFRDGDPEEYSLRDVSAFKELCVLVHVSSRHAIDLGSGGTDRDATVVRTRQPVFSAADFGALAGPSRLLLLADRSVVRVEWVDDHNLIAVWGRDPSAHRMRIGWGSQLADIVAIPGTPRVSVLLHQAFDDTYNHAILNAEDGFVQWLLQVEQAAAKDDSAIDPAQWQVLMRLLASPVWYGGFKLEELARFVERWRALGTGGLEPPEMPTASAFARNNLTL